MIWTVSLMAFALFAGCGDAEDDTAASCTQGEFQCTEDNVLEECGPDGWEFSVDCTEEGLMCHAEMGHCM